MLKDVAQDIDIHITLEIIMAENLAAIIQNGIEY